jgi:hypothetical protein
MKAGFGKSDITPRLGVQMAGYGPYRNRAAQEIVAPLNARVMMVVKGKVRVVVVSLELTGLPRALDRRIREHVTKLVRVDADDVFLAVTHTHSCPSVGGMLGWGEADAMYVETLPGRVAAAVVEAKANLKEVEWRQANGPCEGIAVNRETDTGFALNADFAERMKLGWRPEHPEQTDPTVRVLAAYADQQLVGVIHHFGCHPVVYGEKTNAVHGDFVGEASRLLENAHAGAVALFLPGALGDINPRLNHRNPEESKGALTAIGRQYAEAVQAALQQASPIEVGVLRSIRREVTFSRKPWTRTMIERRIRKLQRLFDAPGTTDLPHVGGQPPLMTNGMELARLEGLRSVWMQFEADRAPNPPVTVHGVQLGPLALLGCGLELYHSLQAVILAGSPQVDSWVVSLVGGMGYAPDAAAHQRAGYAGDFVPLIGGEIPYANIQEELPVELVKLAWELGA